MKTHMTYAISIALQLLLIVTNTNALKLYIIKNNVLKRILDRLYSL